ncbi:MAG: Zn-ribbon domain-containing OB-fold protein [Candidatus Hodarchaeota archaeon]
MIKISKNYLIPFKSKHIQKFWDELKNKKLFALKCKECGKKFFPPLAHCPKCLSNALEWFELSGEGTLYSWTSVEYIVENPYILGIIELKEKIGRSIARIIAEEKDLKINMKMKAKYINQGDSHFLNWIPIP